MHISQCHRPKQAHCQTTSFIASAGTPQRLSGFMPTRRLCSLVHRIQHAAQHRSQQAVAACSTSTTWAQPQLTACSGGTQLTPHVITRHHHSPGAMFPSNRSWRSSTCHHSIQMLPAHTCITARCTSTTTLSSSHISTTPRHTSNTWSPQTIPMQEPQLQDPLSTTQSVGAAQLSVTPLPMDHRHVHVIWCSTQEVDWSKVTLPWLSSLPPDEVETVNAASDVRGGRRTRLLARVIQRTTVSAALAGLQPTGTRPDPVNSTSPRTPQHTEPCQQEQHQHVPVCQDLTPKPHQPHHINNQQITTQHFPTHHTTSQHHIIPNQSSSHTSSISPTDLRFTRNRHGKPFLMLDRTVPPPHKQPTTLTDLQENTSSTSSTSHASSGDTGSSCHTPCQPCIWSADLGLSMHTPQTKAPTTSDAQPPTTNTMSSSSAAETVSGSYEPCLQFNLSHTHNLVGCAVGPAGMAMGLDVEVKGRVPKGGIMALAKRRFAPAEVEALKACPDEVTRVELFTYLWTLKEAFVKARGTGISATPSLRGFAVGVHPMTSCTDQDLSRPDLSSIIHQLMPVQPSQPPSSSVSGTCSTTSNHLLRHITLDLTGQGVTHHDTHGLCTCLSECKACEEQPQYHLVLMEPSKEHIAALCVVLPAQCSWPVSVSRGDVTHRGDEANAVRLSMWRGVPGHTLSSVTCTLGPMEDTDSIRVIGCTTTSTMQQ